MNVLSLFDGISCGQVALHRAAISYDRYFASEIDKNAIKVTQANFPKTIQIGDVTQVKAGSLPKIDLLMGGSPCQGFSLAGNQLAFDDPRSKLFFEFVRLKKELNPKWWLLENVKMKAEHVAVISEFMGCEPVFIDSRDFSAQSRKRLYWTNIPIACWQPKGVKFSDIEEHGPHLAKFKVNRTPSREKMWGGGINGKCVNLSRREKACCLTTKQDRWSNTGLVEFEDFCRYVTPLEAERLQTLPDGYTSGLADSHRYHALGNGWTVDVIAHILRGINT